MDILIESTREFEKDIALLNEDEKAVVIQKMNYCASLFPTQKSKVYRKLRRIPLSSDLNGYDDCVKWVAIEIVALFLGIFARDTPEECLTAGR